MADDCSQNTDPLKLVREGTSQDARVSAALDPASAPANALTVAHGIVFAQDYAQLLKRYDRSNTPAGDWQAYFGADVAVPLAIAAIADLEAYKTTVRSWFDYLNDMDNSGQHSALRDRLGYLYAAVGALALGLDGLKHSLPDTVALRGTLQNLIQTQLAPAFFRLIAYYKGGVALGVVNAVAPTPALQILRRPVGTFASVLGAGLSTDWSGGAAWAGYEAGITADTSVYGAGGAPDPFMWINHCSTHNLFRSVFDQFLKVFMRAVSEARTTLGDIMDNFSGHPPHYALFLAFLQLMEHARTAGNTLTQKHLDFYYRTVLGLTETAAQPGAVHLLAELAKQASSYDFASGRLFKAGKDTAGKEAFFANAADFVANKASVAALMTVYRHGTEPLKSGARDEGRIFASPVANSDDGKGAPLTSIDQSWHPFFNKIYVDGALSAINMPDAEIGFAIASHYLLLAEGTRTLTIELATKKPIDAKLHRQLAGDVSCYLTTAKGWLQKAAVKFNPAGSNILELVVELDGADDAIVPYAPAVHGYNFNTKLPMLRVALLQNHSSPYIYPALQPIAIANIDLTVTVVGVKTLAVANDFGPVDLSKPFQPFGSSPVAGSSLVIGSKEIFQKHLTAVTIDLKWQIAPTVYPSSATVPNAYVDFLKGGSWDSMSGSAISVAPNSGNPVDTTAFVLNANLEAPVLEVADFTPNEAFTTQARQGFVRLRLDGNIGQSAYLGDLITYLRNPNATPAPTNPGPTPPQGPTAATLTMTYTATSSLALNTSSKVKFGARPGQFFHLAPFGTAEQHPVLTGGDAVFLLPQFGFQRDSATPTSEAEFYIGVAGLVPPQNLSILFQVVDGTANPLALKPVPHIDWCYLANNQWVEFPDNAVVDSTGELLDSGIVTLAVPREATSANMLLPSGLHWIRGAVHEASDAVCRLQRVAAQAMRAVFSNQGNAPDFSATPLAPGTISKLATPDAAVKGITQPYPSFGGRGAERPQDFYRRVSERLRHKDRAIDLWDYEHLILEAYPQIYKVKCLNHTCYEPAEGGGSTSMCGGGTYRELAPGHVTIITLPNLQAQRQRDPLKPYTSLGLLLEIRAFILQRTSSFVQLHVRNPQFEEVRVTFKLKLYPGYDEAAYTTQLQQAITRWLSPWAFTGVGAPSFGGSIHKSALINFVEQQVYVDYVTDFQLFLDIPCQGPGTIDLDLASGSRAVSILVSAPASKHKISIIEAAADQTLAETCGCGA